MIGCGFFGYERFIHYIVCLYPYVLLVYWLHCFRWNHKTTCRCTCYNDSDWELQCTTTRPPPHVIIHPVVSLHGAVAPIIYAIICRAQVHQLSASLGYPSTGPTARAGARNQHQCGRPVKATRYDSPARSLPIALYIGQS